MSDRTPRRTSLAKPNLENGWISRAINSDRSYSEITSNVYNPYASEMRKAMTDKRTPLQFYDRVAESRPSAEEVEKMAREFAQEFYKGVNPYGEMLDEMQKFLAAFYQSMQERITRRWIPVTEREPELYQYVNTFCEKGHVSFRRWDGLPALVGMCGAPITHWQPLPAPPTERKP